MRQDWKTAAAILLVFVLLLLLIGILAEPVQICEF